MSLKWFSEFWRILIYVKLSDILAYNWHFCLQIVSFSGTFKSVTSANFIRSGWNVYFSITVFNEEDDEHTERPTFWAQFVSIFIGPKPVVIARGFMALFGPIKMMLNWAKKVGVSACSSSSSLKTVMEKYTFQPDPIKFALVF